MYLFWRGVHLINKLVLRIAFRLGLIAIDHGQYRSIYGRRHVGRFAILRVLQYRRRFLSFSQNIEAAERMPATWWGHSLLRQIVLLDICLDAN